MKSTTNKVTKNALPDHLMQSASGHPRTVGFEVEFAGLSFPDCLELLAKTIGGEIKHVSPVEATVEHPEFGPFALELDWQFLKQQAKSDLIGEDFIEAIADFASNLVPLEIVLPPIPVDRLDVTDKLVEALAGAGASGTGDSPLYAFGVHINTEIPALDASTIARYLKAYCILQDYLVREHSIDTSRRLSPYIDLFEAPYMTRVLDYEDSTIDEVIGDYLELNPTRNRALDMLPMFAEIDPARIAQEIDDDRVKARPTFHYRMPNCNLGEPDWSLISEWNRWCQVEILANDKAALAQLGQEYRNRLRANQFTSDAVWADYVKAWVDRNTA